MEVSHDLTHRSSRSGEGAAKNCGTQSLTRSWGGRSESARHRRNRSCTFDGSKRTRPAGVRVRKDEGANDLRVEPEELLRKETTPGQTDDMRALNPESH